MTSRREFLATTAALAWTTRAEQLQRELSVQDPWDRVRGEFLIPSDRVYLNIGTLGPQPQVVVDAIIEHTRRVAMSLPPALDWNALRNEIGALLNCDPAGLVFPRNTTE